MHLRRAQFWIPMALGGAHALADCTSGYLLGTLPADAPSPLLLVIGYNALAFAGQLPAGMLADRLGRPRLLLALALGAILAGLLLKPFSPVGAVVLAGLGSALFHVSGGMVTLRLMPDRAGAAGLFTGPGVMGLAVGGLCAGLHLDAHWPLVVLLALAVLGMAALPLAHLPAARQAVPEGHKVELHDLVMLLLLMGIAFRSVVWNVLHHAHQGDHALLLCMAGAAMCGKLAGGWLADWMGWRRFTYLSLGGAVLLLSLGGGPWIMLPGIMLLQAATPVALAAMYRAMPQFPATASGMALGLAIAAGGIPFALPSQSPEMSLWWVLPPAAVALALQAVALARMRRGIRG